MTKPVKPKATDKAAPGRSTKPGSSLAPAPEAKPAHKGRAAAEPLMLTEKVFVRSRPEKVYFAAVNPATRSEWDKNISRARFAKPSKSEPAATKPVQGAMLELFFPLRLGGLFQMEYALIRQPQGFALQAKRGSFGLLAGLAETWQFEPFKGGTQVTLVRQLVPRFGAVRQYVETNQKKALKSTLEGLKKHVEEAQK